MNHELETKGRTIRAHIRAFEDHKDRCVNHRKSGGILLLEVKQELSGLEFNKFLLRHRIPIRTACDWMRRVSNPESHEAEKERARDRMEETRQKADMDAAGLAEHELFRTDFPNTTNDLADFGPVHPLTTKQPQEVIIAARMRVIKRALKNPEILDAVFKFLSENDLLKSKV